MEAMFLAAKPRAHARLLAWSCLAADETAGPD
jgi:hypothetical protein